MSSTPPPTNRFLGPATSPADRVAAAPGDTPVSKKAGTGLTFPKSKTGFRDVLDDTSNMLAFAEVNTFNSYLRDSLDPASLGIATPSLPAQVLAYGGNFNTDSGHTD